MTYSVCCPSYKRADRVKTTERYPYVKLYVAESEADGYRAWNSGTEVVAVPDAVQGNVARIRNYILDREFEGGADGVVLVDDDVHWFARFDRVDAEYGPRCGETKLDAEELLGFIEQGMGLCDEWGFKFWGMNPNGTDRLAYRQTQPFSTLSFVGGPFQGFLPSSIRYDENLPLKEDYDMTLQHIREYGGVLRFNAYHYECDQANIKGGCAAVRNAKYELEQFRALQRKWGSRVVKADKSSVRGFDFNPIIKVPVRGV